MNKQFLTWLENQEYRVQFDKYIKQMGWRINEGGEGIYATWKWIEMIEIEYE